MQIELNCIMGNVGFSVLVAWPLLGTKSQVISASVAVPSNDTDHSFAQKYFQQYKEE